MPDIVHRAVCQGLLPACSLQAMVVPHDRVVTRPRTCLHMSVHLVSPWLKRTCDVRLLGQETASMGPPTQTHTPTLFRCVHASH
jgi:hypothetical protein